jgi:hypothetical protein
MEENERTITEGQKKLYEKRRLKKELSYHEGYVEALSLVMNQIELDDKDFAALEMLHTQKTERIEQINLRIKKL